MFNLIVPRILEKYSYYLSKETVIKRNSKDKISGTKKREWKKYLKCQKVIL